MRLRIFLLTASLLACLISFGQQDQDSIEIKRTFFGTSFKYEGKTISYDQMKGLMLSNPEALKEIKAAGKYFISYRILAAISAAFILWPVFSGQYKVNNWTSAYIGAGVFLVMIPVSVAYVNHTKKAVRIYNHDINQLSTHPLTFRIGVVPNGLRIRMVF